MTLQLELLNAILSMDSYNRGYSGGLNTLSDQDIGTASIALDSSIFQDGSGRLDDDIIESDVPLDADPWIRDNKGMLAIDHAEVRRDRIAMRLVYDAMYPDGRVPFKE